MFRNEKLEMKVGLFIGKGIFLMFFIVFSISDFAFFEDRYNIKTVFDFANGIKQDAPVRLAGVHVGEVKTIDIFYDQEAARTRVRLDLWIRDNIRVETDAVARINTLGLLGEQYLEITPGKAETFLRDGDEMEGKTPVNVGEQMEKMSEFVSRAANLAGKIDDGQGTLGRLLNDDELYRDLETIFGRLARGEGTIGKLLVKETIYDNVEELTADIKDNPWKLLRKDTSSGSKRPDIRSSRGSIIQPR